MAPIRLNIGAGDQELEGFCPIDIRNGDDAAQLDYADGIAAEVRASHVLEHFSYRQVPAVLKEWVRVLKPGGLIRIAVPDLDCIIRDYQSDAPSPLGVAWLMGGQVDEHDFHRAAFNEPALRGLLRQAGIGRIGRWTSEASDCASLPCSLNLQGYKRTSRELPDVMAVMSMPRLCFSDNFLCAWRALRPLKTGFSKASGAYWDQAMTALFEKALDEPRYRYLLTLDYDTVFTSADVLDLHQTMEAHPDIEAIAATQMRRESCLPLCAYDKAPTLAEIAVNEVATVATAHFGLTLIRADALRATPLPWFEAKAGTDGRWEGDNGHLDADVSFWHKWKEAGHTVCQANRVVVGHIEQVVTWPDKHFHPCYQKLSDYEEHGKPEEVA